MCGVAGFSYLVSLLKQLTLLSIFYSLVLTIKIPNAEWQKYEQIGHINSHQTSSKPQSKGRMIHRGVAWNRRIIGIAIKKVLC